jgi:hypothetical protein
MASKRSKEKRERRKVSAKSRHENYQGMFESTAIKLPDGVQSFSLKRKGKYNIDIIPFEAGKGNPFYAEGTYQYERTFYTHRGVGLEENKHYICSQALHGKAKTPLPDKKKDKHRGQCPICDFIAKESRNPRANQEFLKNLKLKERQLFNVFDHDNPEAGVQVWEISSFLFGQLLDERTKPENLDDDEQWILDFADPDEGATLKLTVKEDSMEGGRKFFKVASIDFKARREPLSDELLEAAVCLDDLVKETPYEKLEAIFLQSNIGDDDDDDEDDEDEDDDKPKKGKSSKPAKGKSSKRPAKDEDEDEDDDEDEDEDDDEDEDEDDDEDKPEWPGDSKVGRMDRDALVELIEQFDLPINPDEHKRAKALAAHCVDAYKGVGAYAADEDDDDEEEEEEEPKPKKGKSSKSSKPAKAKPKKGKDADEDEDDDDDSEPEDDDDEDEDDDEDWDWSDDDEDEEDDDDKPAKGKGKKSSSKKPASGGKRPPKETKATGKTKGATKKKGK